MKVQSPEQRDVESDATEPQAPSKLSAAADVQTTGAGTDTGDEELHHSAAASTIENTPKSPSRDDAQTQVVPSVGRRAGGSQPATDPIPQQSPTLSRSQRLWNAAYDKLEEDKDTAELVRSYVETITKVLGANIFKAVVSGGISAELENPAKRQKYMEDLVKEGQSKIATASEITKGVGDVARFILSAKGMIDAAIQNIPQAALPWAGVCIGLQVGNHPSQLPSLRINCSPSRSS